MPWPPRCTAAAASWRILRALGTTRLQSRLVVVTQASVLAAVGLAVGVPLGFAVGRFIWRLVAQSTPLAYHPPLAFWALVLIGAAGAPGREPAGRLAGAARGPAPQRADPAGRVTAMRAEVTEP